MKPIDWSKLEQWNCPCGKCNSEDGYADWSNECLNEFKEQMNESEESAT